MKKIIPALALAGALLLGAALPALASGHTVTTRLDVGGSTDATVDPEASYVTVDYSLSMSPAGRIEVIQNEILYDHEFLEFVSAEKTYSDYTAADRINTGGEHHVYYNTTQAHSFTTARTKVGSIRFKLLKHTPGASTTVASKFVLAYDENLDECATVLEDLRITLAGGTAPSPTPTPMATPVPTTTPRPTATPTPSSPSGGGGGTPAATYAVTVGTFAHGTVTVNRSAAAAGTTVTLTLRPDAGYELDTLTVKRANGSSVTVSGAGNTRTFTMPAGAVTVAATFKQSAAPTPTVSPAPAGPASPEVTGVSRFLNATDHLAYITGYEDGTVRPLNSVTRSETAAMLYRLLRNQNVSGGKDFSDVAAAAWYYQPVRTLSAMGIINGYEDGTFGPDKPITRAEFAAMVSRFAIATGGAQHFTDVQAGHWAEQVIATASGYGWVKGYEDGTFRPANQITRCEAATIINRMLNRSADKVYVDSYVARLHWFSDLTDNTVWYYYEMREATEGHDFTRTGEKETWTGLK